MKFNMKTKIKNIIPMLMLWIAPVAVFAAGPSITTAAVKTATDSKNQQNREVAQQGLIEKFSADFFLNLFLWIVVLVITVIIVKIARSKLTDIFEKKLGWDMSWDIAWVVFRTVNIIIWTIWFTTALALWWVDLAFLMWWVWIWLWFTMQVFLWNFIGWLIIIFSGEYQTGRIIEIAWQLWEIKRITSMFTTIEKYDWTCYNVPNVKFLQDEVLVYNMNSKRRIDIDFGVEYSADITKVKKLAIKVTESFPMILQNPASRVLVSEMQDDGVLLTLQFWVSTEEGFYQTKSNVTETLNLAFEQAWITIKKKKLELKQVGEFAKK